VPRTITIYHDHIAVFLAYLAPPPPPEHGANWEDTLDYPGVECQVQLPADRNGKLHGDMQSAAVCAGEPLNPFWGDVSGPVRVKSRVFRAPTLEAAEAAARAWGANVEAVIRPIVSARTTRLIKRDATIAAAHARHGEVTPED